jgi:hypothetical protein
MVRIVLFSPRLPTATDRKAVSEAALILFSPFVKYFPNRKG